MSELVGRFLSFEEHMGRSLVKFVYYVLLFLLVVSTLFEMVAALIAMFDDRFWPNLGQFLVLIPLRFFVSLLLLRVGAELVIAVLSIDDNLQNGHNVGDTMSSGLNPAPVPPAPSRMNVEPAEPEPEVGEIPVAKKAPAKKATKKRSTKKATKKAAKKSAEVKVFTPEAGSGNKDTGPKQSS
jgi:hypothetical protein